MRVEWFGQSAFEIRGSDAAVFIDPFHDLTILTERGIAFEYPAIEVGAIDLVLVSHEHGDHNGVEAIGGEPAILRATPGRHDSPVGEVLGIASEHDEVAGTERGPNTIFAFELDGLRVAHFGDFGQSALRPEQAAQLGGLDLLLLPVGAGPTIGPALAAEIVAELDPRWVVPMHYRTPKVGFLDTEEAFLELMSRVERLDSPSFETDDLPSGDGPLVVVAATP